MSHADHGYDSDHSRVLRSQRTCRLGRQQVREPGFLALQLPSFELQQHIVQNTEIVLQRPDQRRLQRRSSDEGRRSRELRDLQRGMHGEVGDDAEVADLSLHGCGDTGPGPGNPQSDTRFNLLLQRRTVRQIQSLRKLIFIAHCHV